MRLPGSRSVTAALLVAVSVPFIVGAIQLLIDARRPFYLVGDQALIEIAVRRSVEFLQFTGPYSRFGWDHPGPLYFFLLAPATFLVGNGVGIYFGALTINWLFSLLGIGLLARAAGPRTATAVTAIVLVYLYALGPFALRDPWNPEIVVIPLTAALLAVAVRPTVRAIALGAFAGSLALQAHFGTVSVVAAFIVTAVLVHGLAFIHERFAWLRADGQTSWWPRWRALVIVGAVVTVSWSLPLFEQARNGVFGNFGKIVYFNLHNSSGERHGVGEAAQLVLGSSWLPSIPFLVPPPTPPGSLVLWVLGWFVVSGGGALMAMRRRQRVPFVLLVFAAAGYLVVTLAVSRITGQVYVYLLWWTALPAVALLAGWAALLFGEAGLVSRAFPRAGAVIVVLGLVVATLSNLALTLNQRSLHRFSRDDVREAANYIEATLPAGQRSGVIRLEIPDPEVSPYTQGTATELMRDGYSVQVGGGLARFYETRSSNGTPIATYRLAKANAGNDTGGVRIGQTHSGESVSVRKIS